MNQAIEILSSGMGGGAGKVLSGVGTKSVMTMVHL